MQSAAVRKAEAVSPRARGSRRIREEWRFALAMTLPAFFVVFLIMGFPWLYSLWMSLNFVNLLTQQWIFVGLGNYQKILPDPGFVSSFLRTAWFSAVVVLGSTALGLLMALALNLPFRGRALMRSVMLMPWAVAPVVVGKLFTLIYSGQYGTLNGLLYQFGLIDQYIPFLADGQRALLLVSVAAVWQSAPLTALLLLAGLQAIPTNLYRAARIDGAGPWQTFRKITFPWLRPMLLLVVILNTINAVMAFDLVYVITQGGPGESTTVLSWLGYITFFNFARYGEGTAILYILSLISLLLAVVYFRLLIKREPRPVAPDTIAYVATRPAEAARRLDLQTVRPVLQPARLSPGTRRRLGRIATYVAVLLIALWSLGPFYVLLNASLSTTDAILGRPPDWFPNPITFENYQTAIQGEEVQNQSGSSVQGKAILISMGNSAIVAVATTVLNILIGAPAGYAFARFGQYRFVSASFWLLMLTRMIPSLTLAVPFFMIFRQFGLTDTKIGLIIAMSSIILPLTIWIMKGYFETLPANMERAAYVDGATRWQSFRKIVLPVAIPGLTAAAIFCFLVAWNEFIYAILLTATLRSQTLPTRIAQFVSDQRIYNPGLLFAAGMFAILPPILITLVFQKYLLRGLLSGAVKG
jgi:ABC-type glycerol-3-phosphate transport system permease component